MGGRERSDDIPEVKDATEAFEEALRRRNEEHCVLRLYVAGSTPNSERAIENLRRLCDEHLAGRYDLQVIDIYQNPGAAESADVIAAPTLVKELPPPVRRMIGDLSNKQRVLVGLDIRPKAGG